MALNSYGIFVKKTMEKIKEEIRSIPQKPVKLLFSVLVTVFMLALTVFAWESGGVNGL